MLIPMCLHNFICFMYIPYVQVGLVRLLTLFQFESTAVMLQSSETKRHLKTLATLGLPHIPYTCNINVDDLHQKVWTWTHNWVCSIRLTKYSDLQRVKAWQIENHYLLQWLHSFVMSILCVDIAMTIHLASVIFKLWDELWP